MTEQEYVNATDLDRVRCAKNILRDALPEMSQIITMEEKAVIFQILNRWEEKLFMSININEDKAVRLPNGAWVTESTKDQMIKDGILKL